MSVCVCVCVCVCVRAIAFPVLPFLYNQSECPTRFSLWIWFLLVSDFIIQFDTQFRGYLYNTGLGDVFVFVAIHLSACCLDIPRYSVRMLNQALEKLTTQMAA